MTDRWKPWARRTLAIAWHATSFVLLTAGFVPLFVLCALFDATRGKEQVVTRTLVFLFWYLLCELAGTAAALSLWVADRLLPHNDARRFRTWNYALARSWTRLLATGAMRIFRVRMVIEASDYAFGTRPLIVFARHASNADAVLAALLVAVPNGIRMRYVLPRRLLWNPCIDILGRRLPNVFVRRNIHTGREISALRALARDLAPGDGLFFHPEAERFTPARKRRAVARLRTQGRDRAAREAAWLRHLLPPRPGEAHLILEAAPDADVLFLAHTGAEASASFDHVFRGGLVGKTVHAKFIVVPSCDIPSGRDAREAWLKKQWREMDQFIEEHKPPAAPFRLFSRPAVAR